LLFFLITSFVVENKKREPLLLPPSIQYDEIIVSGLLNRISEKYYVLSYVGTENLSLYNAYLQVYKTKSNSTRVHSLNLENAFNYNFLKEESNFVINSIEDIAFSQDTLLLIEKGKIVSVFEGKEAILIQLESMVK
jgi:hypothetical protein